MATYYNEIEPFAAQWIRNLASHNLIPDGVIDDRSIVDVDPEDLRDFTQCHFFAGIGGWALAGRLAGWPDNRVWWTGSCPCQPWSGAGPGMGADDPRHLWPHFFRLIRTCRPAVVMGEQVPDAIGKGWLDGVWSDMESIKYAFRACRVPSCSNGAPQERERIYFVADADASGLPECEQRKEPDATEFGIESRSAITERGGARGSWWGGWTHQGA